MAFKKVGDDMPIIEFYDEDEKCERCPKCGEKLSLIVIDSGKNQLVCDNCDAGDFADAE